MCNILKHAIDERLNIVENEQGFLLKLSPYVKWYGPLLFTEKGSDGIGSALGVYKIIHCNDGLMAIGQGKVGNRRNRHKAVFLNNGNDVIHESGASSGSATGRHMYHYDPVLTNWSFTWCNLGNKRLAETYERLLIEYHKPLLNNESMAGV